MKKTIKVFLTAIGILILAGSVFGIHYLLNRPLPVSVDDPEAQPIKDVLVRSHEIQAVIVCDPQSDINLLATVFLDTTDFSPDKHEKVLITKYLGDEAIQQSGYLTYMKAYYLWRRSGDPYPETPSTPVSSAGTVVVSTEKPIIYCPKPLSKPKLSYQSIAIRDNRAVVEYSTGPYVLKAILIKEDGIWFIGNVLTLGVYP